MGCGELSKIKKSQSVPLLISARVSKELRKGETLNTDQNSRLSYRALSVKVPEYNEKICLKFRIFEEFHDLIAQEISSSMDSNQVLYEYITDIKKIKKYWIMFRSAVSYFDLATHGSCIDDYKISDGVAIMLISCVASGKNFDTDILFHIETPYIVFLSTANCHKETIFMMKAWQNLTLAMLKLSGKKIDSLEKILEKFFMLIGQHEKYIPKSNEERDIKKSKKHIKNLILVLKKLISDLKDSHKQMKEFVGTFKAKRSEIEELGELALKKLNYSGDQIVHYIICK
ncbi:hypothetical protein SteCoe_23070 [Stentor coeruleus]|uniref:Uncharacterized protein n=1 Tax=Stentor coeruleus TaxID=5963 RepID=A0A1R2BKS6_9CILI|nr:hypothetical protein SteCoe_23070 [Stentor coeruleus]